MGRGGEVGEVGGWVDPFARGEAGRRGFGWRHWSLGEVTMRVMEVQVQFAMAELLGLGLKARLNSSGLGRTARKRPGFDLSGLGLDFELKFFHSILKKKCTSIVCDPI